jgi:nitric oxide reductase subunit C
MTLSLAALAGCAQPGGDAEAGRQLYQQQTIGSRQAPGCVSCHSLEPGKVIVGPSHAHVASRAAEQVNSSGYNGQASDARGYLRESILEPNAHIVEGFDAGIMYQDYAEVLSQQQVDDLVAFLLTQQ